jgi:hypothetical protein
VAALIRAVAALIRAVEVGLLDYEVGEEHFFVFGFFEEGCYAGGDLIPEGFLAFRVV